MKTFNTLLSNYKTISRDSSSGNETLGKTLINDSIREILAMEDWTFNRGTDTQDTVANTQYYDLAYNCWRLRKITVNVSDTIYTPAEVKDEVSWSILNRVSTSSDIPTYYFVKPSTNEFGLYPTSSTAGYTITQTFQKKVKDLGVSDYTTGTVTATNGSTAIVGSGTTFTAAMVGEYIKVTDYWYKIESFTDITHITIDRNFGETTVSGSTFTISELIPLPDGFENMPLWKALGVYFDSRENTAQANNYDKKYETALSNLYKRDSKTSGDILTQSNPVTVDINNWPTLS